MSKKIFFVAVIVSFLFSCRKDQGDPDTKGYPAEVGQIILTKCAVSGCHNEISYEGAGGLNLSSWEKLFEGGSGSACVIPYRSDFSTMCYYVNSFPDLGPTLIPRMPLNLDALSRQEVETLYSWINSGAKNNKGEIKFSGDPLRKKMYVLNQGCREVTVFDEASKLPMRYITVEIGNTSPHMIRISPDKQFWYVISIGGGSIKKYKSSDDTYAGEIAISNGNYNTFAISHDSKKAWIVDFSVVGRIIEVDLENMTLLNTYTSGDWTNIHGSCIDPTGQFLYVTSQYQNRIFKIPVNDFSGYTEIVLNSSAASQAQGVTDPHEVIFSPDGSKYFVSCQASNEVRVFQSANDSLLSAVSVGTFPSEFAFSLQHPYLFVSCMEDVNHLNAPSNGKKGVVSVLNYQTGNFVQHIDGGFYQPHGVAVNETSDVLVVASRNQESNGPAPHHTTSCGGRSGYVTFIDLTTLQKTGKRVEVATDPYSVTIRE
jgi:DNA-binding beta-propeller fold protein YncE